MSAFLTTLRDLDARATPGPWDWFTSHATSEIDGGALLIQDTKADQMRFMYSPGSGQGFAHTVGLHPEEDSANAALISLLRTHAPRIAALIEAAGSHQALLDAPWHSVPDMEAARFDASRAVAAALAALDKEAP